ncbi:MAG: hypothetical protein R3B67_06105 [Phycisphaerales bacterium]
MATSSTLGAAFLELLDKEGTLGPGPLLPIDQVVPFLDEPAYILIGVLVGIAYRAGVVAVVLLPVLKERILLLALCHVVDLGL